jgi:cellulose synthase/poly-beta-1,6-N-acetylglucosamine synthase-like glycosyltransferase
VRTTVSFGAFDPELSAARVFSRPQAAILGALLVALGIVLAIAPASALVGLVLGSCIVSLLGAAHYLLVVGVGVVRPAVPASGRRLADGDLPSYTILAPLRQEAAVVADLVRAFEALDYPDHLLEVKLIVEVDDLETLEALEAIPLRPRFELLRLPRGTPRTKPRACNFGLAHTHSELVVIYDAEDQPEPQQLRKAAAALQAAPPEVACLQAKLHVWNPDSNSLARYGASEFAHVCEVVRAGLERLDAPILLCGTSSHFRVSVLREMAGWDEFNVAEDADLGIRLARAGYRTRLFDSNTYEEANTRLWNWVRQRSRWIKGWLQTWLVHNRHPLRLWNDLGPRRAAHLQLTLMAQIAPVLLTPVMWALPLLWLLGQLGVHSVLPGWLLAAGSLSFALATATEVLTHAIGLRRAGYHQIVRSSLWVPVYGLLKSVATVKAIGQLMSRPHYWEKTVHGLETEQPILGWTTIATSESSG